MWISVVAGAASGADLQLPPGIRTDAPGRTYLRYGIGRVGVSVARPESLGRPDRPGMGQHPDFPAPVIIRPEIIRKLCIRTEPVYRMLLAPGGIEIGPVLGLLLGNRNHWYTGSYLNREPERVAEVGRRTGGLMVAFSPRTLSLRDGCAYGLFFDPTRSQWSYGALPIPSIVHRRSFHQPPHSIERLWELGVQVFNSRRYTKWELYQILSRDEQLRRHLPETAAVTDGREVFDMLGRHESLVLKPSELSRGRGILFVSNDDGHFRVQDCRSGSAPVTTRLDPEQLAAFLAGEIADHRYLCQAKIELATIDGAPFDIRVVMHRTPNWQCTGMECRLAGPGQLVTNIAHGGRALWLEDAVQEAFGDAAAPTLVREEAVELARRVCHLLEHTGESFGEFGIDLALDQRGNMWFIEANVIPTFHGFESLDRATYRRLLAAPLLYAGHLAGFDVWGG